ncbi:MAG: hypothetical protein WA618_15240 [Terriglobales bacterium]
MNYTDLFLQFFPACLLFCTLAFIVTDSWRKADARDRRVLAGRVMKIDGVWCIISEDGFPHQTIDGYFDELPVLHSKELAR